jgi:hypothetical protein
LSTLWDVLSLTSTAVNTIASKTTTAADTFVDSGTILLDLFAAGRLSLSVSGKTIHIVAPLSSFFLLYHILLICATKPCRGAAPAGAVTLPFL